MIKQETLGFLREIGENNHKQWFDANKPRYEAAKENVLTFTHSLFLETLVSDFLSSKLRQKINDRLHLEALNAI